MLGIFWLLQKLTQSNTWLDCCHNWQVTVPPATSWVTYWLRFVDYGQDRDRGAQYGDGWNEVTTRQSQSWGRVVTKELFAKQLTAILQTSGAELFAWQFEAIWFWTGLEASSSSIPAGAHIQGHTSRGAPHLFVLPPAPVASPRRCSEGREGCILEQRWSIGEAVCGIGECSEGLLGGQKYYFQFLPQKETHWQPGSL